MASADLARLRRMIHQEGWAMNGFTINIDNAGAEQVSTAKAELKRGEETLEFVSSDDEVVFYLFQNQQFHEPAGGGRLAPVKDLGRHWDDIRHLVDEDKSKVRAAVTDLVDGKFKFDYSPPELIDASLSDARPHAKKYEPLKRDHHHIVAYHLLVSRDIVAARDRLLARRPGAKTYIDAAESITRAYRRGPNPVEDYNRYRKYADFDFPAYGRRVQAQNDAVDDLVHELVQVGSVRPRQGIPKLLKIHKTLLEVAQPVLNVLRAASEIQAGQADPEPTKGLTENVAALRSHPQAGPAFEVLDINLRNAEAHASWEIKDNKLLVYDHRGKRSNLLGEYDYGALAQHVQELHLHFFPAILNVFAMQEVVMRDLVVLSPEHKLYLVNVGNTA